MKLFMTLCLAFMVIACQNVEAKSSQTNLDEKSETKKTRTEFRYEISEIAEASRPFVVSINTAKEVRRSVVNPLEQFFFGRRVPQNYQEQKEVQQGLGSGVIVSNKGYVLTNNHVVEGADEIKVSLFDGREYDAEIVGLDAKTDIAVIKLKGDLGKLPFAKMGTSDDLRVGEWVVAIGSPFGLNHTVTTGIVSAKNVHGRGITSYENFIQTDAAINPGNSGGALLNLDGELIGINTAILSRSGGFQGIGFAIPVSMARSVMDDLISDGKVKRGWLGVGIQDLTENLVESLGAEDTKGVLVAQVQSGSPAEEAGMQTGDIILEVDEKRVSNTNELRNLVASLEPNKKVKVRVFREGKEKTLKVNIGELEENSASGNGVLDKKSPLYRQYGMELEPLDEELKKQYKLNSMNSGLLVVNIKSQSLAEKAGLRKGDVIIKSNGQFVKNLAEFEKSIKTNQTLLWIDRQGSKVFTVLKSK